VYSFDGCHACVFLVSRSSYFGDSPFQARVGGDCLVAGGFSCWEAIVIYTIVPCGEDDLGLCCCIFGQF